MRCYRLAGFKILVLLVIIGWLFTVVRIDTAAETALSVSQYDIDLVLRPDGSCGITETICLSFQEDSDRITVRIPKNQSQTLTIDQITISESEPTQNKSVPIEILPDDLEAEVQKPLTYRLTNRDQSVELNIKALAEADQSRRLRLSYRLDPLVLRHTDTVVLDHPFFASLGAVDRKMLALSIRLEGIEAVDHVRFWAMPISRQPFTRDLNASDAFIYQTDQLPADQPPMVMVALFELSLFPGAPDAEQPLGWEHVEDIATVRAENARQNQTEHDIFNQLLIAFALLAAAGSFIWLYWRYDHESAVIYRQKIGRDIPEDLPPALFAQLLRRKRYARILLATLMDLVRRGVLRREGFIFIRDTDSRTDSSLTRAYEIYLMAWLFDHVAVSDRVSISELRAYARRPEMGEEFRAYFQQFIWLTEDALADDALIDQQKTRTGRWIARGLAGCYGLLVIVMVFLMKSPAGLWLVIPTLGFLAYGFLLRRLTNSGCEQFARTQAIRRAIRRPWKLSPSADLSFCARALPIAIVMGSEKHLVKYIRSNPDDLQTESGSIEWNRLSLQPGKGDWEASLDRLRDELQAMESLISVSLLLTGSLPL